MLLWYLQLAVRSLKRTPALTALTVLAIGVGISVPTVTMSIRHVFAQDPIPHKSDVLYNVRVESWGLDSEFFNVLPGDPPKHVTYRDMAGLMEIDIPRYETGVAAAAAFAFPGEGSLRPYRAVIRLCHADFFPMFDVPFRYGAPWQRDADRPAQRVVVLSREGNEKLFGGRDSVGETVRLGRGEFTVVGVLDHYRPTPQYYDVINNAVGLPHEFFVPFDSIRDPDLGFNVWGDTDSWGGFDSSDPQAVFTSSELTWIQYWVELEPDQVAAYRDAVDAYALTQKELGRFPRPLNNRVTPLMEWMRVRGVVPPETTALSVIAGLFLVVCCLNLVGLLVGKFLSRAGVLGVHRAMGASRRDVFVQRLVECELLGVLGGLVGLALAWGSLELLGRMLEQAVQTPDILRADGHTIVIAVALSLLAGLLSGVYPAWRACRIPPAMQLKVQ